MAHSQFDQFLQEATYSDHEPGPGLDGDSLYGLYTSWCLVSRQTPKPEHVFWAEIRERVDPGECLHMKRCPAAADYILTSYPAVV